MHKLEEWNMDDTDWMGLSGFCLVTTYRATAIKLKNTLVPKLELSSLYTMLFKSRRHACVVPDSRRRACRARLITRMKSVERLELSCSTATGQKLNSAAPQGAHGTPYVRLVR